MLNTLPHTDNAVLDIRKLSDYCLDENHPQGKHKAKLFASALGIDASNADELRNILLEGLKFTPAVIGRADEYGQRYTVDIEVKSGSKSAKVRTGWIIEYGTDIPRLTTCYPL